MTNTLWIDAFLFGIIGAISLPLGALLSFVWKPKIKVTAALMAFGAGALLAALTMDLVAVAVEKGHFIFLALGCLAGGLFYFALNRLINNSGGAARKKGTLILQLKKLRHAYLNTIAHKISLIPVFQKLPPEELHHLVPLIQSRSYKKGKFLIHYDDPGDRLIIIEKGMVDLIDRDKNIVTSKHENSILGEAELFTGEKFPYSIVAQTDVSAFVIHKTDFDVLVENSAQLSKAVKHIIKNEIHTLKESHLIKNEKATEWYNTLKENLEEKSHRIKIHDITHNVGGKAATVAIAIWLGNFLDAVPESLVVGSSLFTMGTISISLIAGLFLSNFPEALSSSVGLREQNFSKLKILLMWTSITLVTGLGAVAGNVFFVGVGEATLALVDGVAAGAMLTMIAETMLPEAFHLGGSVTGLSTLVGFLSTISCKFI